jgi:type 1 glutamine amidotransferase
MKIPLLARLIAGILPALTIAAGAASPQPTAPLRALLVTGGCCHEYAVQAAALTAGVKKFGDVAWTIVNEGGKSKDARIGLYDDPNWARPYDVVVHNECFADLNDPAYVRKITAAHQAGKPAVVIHCAMHTYRILADDDWREFLGVTSRRHDHQSTYTVKPLVLDHPVMRDFPARWVTPMDELYVIEKLWPKATALASSTSEKDGKDYPVIWVNDYRGTRVFGTTYGHGNATWHDPVFIAVVARGLFWAAGR